jgi:hypothetical protein
MRSIGNVEGKFPVLRTVVAARLLILVLFFTVVGFASAWTYGQSGYRYLFYVLIGLMFTFLFVRLGRLLFTDAGVVITDLGILDRTSDLGFVPWSEIQGASIQRYLGADLIELDMKDDRQLLERVSLFDRYLWKNYVRNYGGRFNIKAGFLKGGATDLHRKLQAHLVAGN